MKAILTKKLTYGRRSIAIPEKGEVPDQLKLWLSDDGYQKRYSVVVDTNELSVDFVLKEGAEQE